MKTKKRPFRSLFCFWPLAVSSLHRRGRVLLLQKRLGLLSPLAEIDSDFQDDRLDVMVKRNVAVVDREPT
jgi:hypothetical protein